METHIEIVGTKSLIPHFGIGNLPQSALTKSTITNVNEHV
jgi:hypothetical protein